MLGNARRRVHQQQLPSTYDIDRLHTPLPSSYVWSTCSCRISHCHNPLNNRTEVYVPLFYALTPMHPSPLRGSLAAATRAPHDALPQPCGNCTTRNCLNRKYWKAQKKLFFSNILLLKDNNSNGNSNEKYVKKNPPVTCNWIKPGLPSFNYFFLRRWILVKPFSTE